MVLAVKEFPMTARNAELVTSHEGNGSSGVGLEQVRLKSSPKRFMPRIARMKRDLDGLLCGKKD